MSANFTRCKVGLRLMNKNIKWVKIYYELNQELFLHSSLIQFSTWFFTDTWRFWLVNERTGSTVERPCSRNIEWVGLYRFLARHARLRHQMLLSPPEGAAARRKNAPTQKSPSDEATNQKYHSRHCQTSRYSSFLSSFLNTWWYTIW